MLKMKKIFAVLLTVLLCISVLPSFAFAEDVLITEASATVIKPEADGHPDFAPVPGDEEKYAVSVSSWYKYAYPYPDLDAQSKFEAGEYYALRIVFTPAEGYAFDDNTEFKVNGFNTSCYGSKGDREIIFSIPQEIFNVSAAAELEQALNLTTPVKEINIVSDFTVNCDCMVYFNGDKINNYHSTVITVNEGVTLTVGYGGAIGAFWPSYEGDWETPPLPNCKIINNGAVIVENGGATEADFDTNNGSITVKDGGSAVVVNKNYGTVTVERGGEYRTTQGNDAENRGTVIIDEGAEMEARFGTSIINRSDGRIVLNGTFRCNSYTDMGSVSHLWFQNDGVVEGHGDVIIAAADSKVMPVNNKDALIEDMMAMLGQETRFENWGDVNIYKLEEASAYEELAAYLNTERTVAGEIVEGNMDTIVLVTENITIPENETVAAMGKVILDSDLRLDIKSGALLECSMENHGIITVESGGKLYTTMGGKIENHTNIAVLEGAELRSQMGSSVINLPDASLIIDGNFYCGCLGIDGNDGMWFENSGNVAGDGAVILYEADHDFAPVSDMEALAAKARTLIEGTGDPLPEIRIAPNPGDINGDREIDNKDLIRLFQYLSEWKVEVNEGTLDVNGDGNTDNKDLIRLFQYLSEWNVEIF